jgi:hypothetical protein
MLPPSSQSVLSGARQLLVTAAQFPGKGSQVVTSGASGHTNHVAGRTIQ